MEKKQVVFVIFIRMDCLPSDESRLNLCQEIVSINQGGDIVGKGVREVRGRLVRDEIFFLAPYAF
jgi:hypothetical protein